MSSRSDYLENAYLLLMLNGTAIANIADNAATSPLTNLYAALHTADPGESGTQSTNECAYTSYARAAIARSSSGFTVSGSAATLTSAISFPQATGGSATATHVSIGVASSGATAILWSAALSSSITITTGVTPQLATGTSITAA